MNYSGYIKETVKMDLYHEIKITKFYKTYGWKCYSHGQSQMINAATPLHKPMKYEIALAEMTPMKMVPSTPVRIDL